MWVLWIRAWQGRWSPRPCVSTVCLAWGQGSPRTSQQEAETFGRAPIAGAGWAIQAGCKGCTAKASKTDSRACRAFSARRARPTTASSRSCEAACATRTCCEWLQWRWGAEGTSTSVEERFCTGSRPVVCLWKSGAVFLPRYSEGAVLRMGSGRRAAIPILLSGFSGWGESGERWERKCRKSAHLVCSVSWNPRRSLAGFADAPHRPRCRATGVRRGRGWANLSPGAGSPFCIGRCQDWGSCESCSSCKCRDVHAATTTQKEEATTSAHHGSKRARGWWWGWRRSEITWISFRSKCCDGLWGPSCTCIQLIQFSGRLGGGRRGRRSRWQVTGPGGGRGSGWFGCRRVCIATGTSANWLHGHRCGPGHFRMIWHHLTLSNQSIPIPSRMGCLMVPASGKEPMPRGVNDSRSRKCGKRCPLINGIHKSLTLWLQVAGDLGS